MNKNLFKNNKFPVGLLVDTNNIAFRAKHSIRHSTEDKIIFSFHLMLSSLLYCSKKFDFSYVAFFLDGKSWRYDFYKNYRIGRRIQNHLKSKDEKEDDKKFLEGINKFSDFLRTKTNVPVLMSPRLEADDLISCWIKMFPQHNFIILSSDSDFQQLISENTILYDNAKKKIMSLNGVYDDNWNRILFDNKTGKPLEVNPEWFLFKKIVRGDISDSVFSAYPGVREYKIRKAFDDRFNQGYDWVSFMSSTWTDIEGNTRVVGDEFEKNKKIISLIDLPEDVIQEANSVILKEITKERNNNVGVWLMQFANKYGLKTVSDNIEKIAIILSQNFCFDNNKNKDSLIALETVEK